MAPRRTAFGALMRVHVFPAGQDGCFAYRQAEPARIAAQDGWEVTIDPEFVVAQDPSGRHVIAKPAERDGEQGYLALEADVALLQRPAKAATADMIEVLHGMGIAVVVDVDDDFSCLHPDHPAFRDFHPKLSPNVNYRHLRRACGMADLVTVTTPALAERYGAHGRVAILPNCVPERLLDMERSSDGRTLGWAGVQSVHPGDLESTRGAVTEALKGSRWRFLNVGPAEGVAEALGLFLVSATGGLTIEEYYDKLGLLDVGIAPLAQTAFNEAKSGLKLLEMSARGVAVVASQTGPYEELAAEGIGLVTPPRARNWRRALLALMNEPDLREEVAQRGRERVRESHLIENEGWRWQEAWAEAAHARQTA